MEKTREEKLAYEIAEALHDLKSIDFHLSCARNIPEDVLRKELRYVLSRQGIDNPAAYYTSQIKRYVKYSRS